MKTKALFTALTTAVVFATGTASAAPIAYEGFDYPAGQLGSANGGSGFTGAWSSNSSTNVAAADLTYGSLATTGGSIGNLGGSINRFGGSRQLDLGANLANGSQLWFSAAMGYDAGGNRTNSTLMLVLGDSAMSGGNFDYNFNTAGDTGLGVYVGRTSGVNGHIQAVQVRDTTFGNVGFAGNVYGTTPGNVLPGSNANVDYRLVVGRFTWGDGSDTLDIFLPDTDLNLGPVHSTLTVDVDQSGYDFLTFKRGDKVVLDEIRFGATSDDVLPVQQIIPSPTAALAGLIGLAGLATRRRRG